MDPDGILMRQAVHPHEVSDDLRRQLVDCWITVSNAGGPVGFPFLPVGLLHVAPVADELICRLAPQQSRLILAMDGDVLAGWVSVRRDLNPLIAHWGTVHHLQALPAFRGRGIGVALMTFARQVARDEMGLEQLRLAARMTIELAPAWRTRALLDESAYALVPPVALTEVKSGRPGRATPLKASTSRVPCGG